MWRDLTDSVNFMAGNLTAQVRNIAQVATAVARGDLSQKIDVDARGEILELKNTLNTMVDQLSSFAEEVTRVAREVGTEGILGGQAEVKGVRGTWKDLTAVRQLHGEQPHHPGPQHRRGDHRGRRRATCRKKITVDAKGEILALVTHRQHDGGPAVGVRRRGDPGGPRGGYRGPAGRPGAGARTSRASGRTSPTTST